MNPKPTKTTDYFILDNYIKDLMSKMEFDQANTEMQQEMHDLMERQILYRLMTALSLNLDTEAAATFAIEAQKPGNDLSRVITKIIETNDAAYTAVMDELKQFEQETLATFNRFSAKSGSASGEKNKK